MKWMAFVIVLGCGSGGARGTPAPDVAPETEPRRQPVSPQPNTDDRAAALRPALSGESLSDDEVLFIDQSLRASDTEYTEHGLATYIEWDLVGVVSSTDDAYLLSVAGPRVDAEWQMRIDRRTGAAVMEALYTIAPQPE